MTHIPVPIQNVQQPPSWRDWLAFWSYCVTILGWLYLMISFKVDQWRKMR